MYSLGQTNNIFQKSGFGMPKTVIHFFLVSCKGAQCQDEPRLSGENKGLVQSCDVVCLSLRVSLNYNCYCVRGR